MFLMVAEYVLPNLPSRTVNKILRELNKPPEQMVVDEANNNALFISNEFLISAERVPDTPVSKLAGVLFDPNAGLFDAVEQDAEKIADFDFAAYLEERGITRSDENGGGIKQLFLVEDNIFILFAGKQDDCLFAELINISSQQVQDRFPCLPELDGPVDFHGIGGGFVIQDGHLIIALGAPEGGENESVRKLAQNPSSPYGKFLRYQITMPASDEVQLVGREIYSSGHRNPQGAEIIAGEILVVEHGPKGGDEINIIRKQQNYGWPDYSFGSNYDDENIIALHPEQDNITMPLWAFVPSVGISDITRCPPAIDARYEGFDCILVSSMRNQGLFIVLANIAKQSVYSVERIEIGARVRELDYYNGRLHLITDYEGIYALSIAEIE